MKLSRSKLEQMIEDLVDRTMEPLQEGARRRRQEGRGHRRGRARRWLDPHPDGAEEGQGVLRQRAAQGRQPRRGRRARRGGPGRRAVGRRQGHPAPRRHAAVARHRDARRRHHRADPAQHDDPDAQERDVLDGGRQPDLGRGPRLPGRAPDGEATTGRSASSSSTASRRRRAACRRSRSRSTSTRTASSTSPPRTRRRARSARSAIEASSGLSEADIKRAVKDAAKHEAEDKARKEAIEARNQLDTLVYGTQKLVKENEAKLADADKLMIEEALKDAEAALETNSEQRLRRTSSAPRSRSSRPRRTRSPRRCTSSRRRASGATDGAGGDGDGGGEGAAQGRGRDRRRVRGQDLAETSWTTGGCRGGGATASLTRRRPLLAGVRVFGGRVHTGAVRLVCLALALAASGCVELGAVTDGGSVSVGKPSNGYLVDGEAPARSRRRLQDPASCGARAATATAPTSCSI